MCSTPEFTNLYIAKVICQHISCVDGVLRNVTACDSEVQKIFLCSALHAQFYLSTLRPFQSAHGTFVSHFFPYKQTVVYHHDTVTGH